LGSTLDRTTQNDKNTRIFLRADKSVDYGDLMEVMNLLREAGYLKIALVGLEGAGAGGATPPETGPKSISDMPMETIQAQ
jgi:biopolymer transport protein ExbD